jgi:hypothetical protein
VLASVLLRRVLPVAIALALGGGAFVVAVGAAAVTSGSERLPDPRIDREGAPKRVVKHVGSLRYVVSPDHRHWHLLGFDRYELRRAGRKTTLVSDRKTGSSVTARRAREGRATRPVLA